MTRSFLWKRSRSVTWTLTLNSCCLYHLVSERKLDRYIEVHGSTEKTCLHQSPTYLATEEDERRCDDLPVFDKCVFHLVGERSTEKKSEREERGEGKSEPAREGVKPTL